MCLISNYMAVPIFSLSVSVYKKIRRKPYCWPLWIYLLDTERLEMSIYAVSWGSDYISSLTVMVLSAEGINWPTSAQLHNPPPLHWFTSYASFECVCMSVLNMRECIQSEPSGLSYLSYLIETSVPLCVQTDLLSGCCKILIWMLLIFRNISKTLTVPSQRVSAGIWIYPCQLLKLTAGVSVIQTSACIYK